MTTDSPTAVVEAITKRVWTYRLDNEPFYRLKRGLPVERLRTGSIAGVAEDAAFARDVLTRLATVDDAVLPEHHRLTVGFLRFLLQTWADAPQHHWHSFGVAPYSSFFLGYAPQHVFGGHAFTTGQDVDRYLSLVADYRDCVSELGAKLDGQRERGILVPRPALPGVRGSLERYRAAAGPLLTVGEDRLTHISSADVARLRTGTDLLLAQEVLPAYDSVLSRLDAGYEAAAGTSVGACHLPDGEQYYRHAVRVHTTSDWPPERIHDVGLEQVQMLADEMAQARSDMGFHGSEADFHAQLAAEPTLYAASPAEVEAVYLRHMAALEPHLPALFTSLPAAPYGVARVPPQMEAGMTFGYYQVPTPAEPVGRYLYNGSDLDKRSLLTAAALILHELAPGHHFHMARQVENTALPDVRREAMDLGAFNEGWAEYAAGLGWDTGVYDAPLDRYGRLVHERFTAQRLVVDTGLNLLGWSLQQARAYVRGNTTDSDVQIATETLRYSTDLPGQALAYRLGFLELQRIRGAAEEALGDRFDVRDYHEQVLGPGALPFPVLAGHVDRWTAGISR